MSHLAEEAYSVYDETYPKARVEHTCAACKEAIRVGHRYARVAMVFDHEAETVKRCMRCQTIHLHLRTKGDSELWPDERLNCGEEYAQHWGEDPPPEIAALAFVTAEEAQQL